MARYLTAAKIVIGALVGLVAGPPLAAATVGAIGFGAAGPVLGTAAAAWQASLGNVVAGSLFSILQSAAMGGTGAGVVGIVSGIAGTIIGAGGGIAASAVTGADDASDQSKSTDEPDTDAETASDQDVLLD